MGLNYEAIKKACARAHKQGKKFCILMSKKLDFNYANGGRGGSAGKILQIWIDNTIEGEKNDKYPQNTSGGAGTDDVCGEAYMDGDKEGEGEESFGATRGYPRRGDSNSAGADKSYDGKEGSCSDTQEDIDGYQWGCGGYSSHHSGSFDGCRDSGRNSYQKATKEVERPLSQEAQRALTLSPKGGSVKVKIKDLENMTRVKAVNEFLACPRGFKKTLWAEGIAKKYEVTVKTLYEWAKTLKNDEIVVKDENLSLDFRAKFRSSSFDIKALEWSVAFWIHNPLASKTRIFEELKKQAAQAGWSIGSYQSFARLLSLPEVKIMLKRTIEGSRGIRNEIAPFVMRDLNLYDSMELICGDQLVFDFKVYDPDGVIINPNGYVWIDMSSGAIIGVDVVFGKYNKYSIGRALKMALSFGVPDAIYTDNGKPELSHYITEIRSQLSGILFKDFDELDPRIVHKKAKPANSRAKPIENIFNHVQRWMRDEIIAEKGGSGYHKREASKKELIQEYMKDLLLSYEEFIHYFSRAVKKWNEHYNQSRKIVPIEAFITKLQASNRSRFDEATLEHIFAPRKMLKVRNSWVQTTIDKEKRTYSHPLLARYVGEYVEVRLQEKNPYSVSIVDPRKNEFICEAELVERIDPRDDALIKATIAKNEKVVEAINSAFAYYKELYKPNYKINAYSHVANRAKTKKEEVKKQVKKIGMSNEELLKAM